MVAHGFSRAARSSRAAASAQRRHRDRAHIEDPRPAPPRVAARHPSARASGVRSRRAAHRDVCHRSRPGAARAGGARREQLSQARRADWPAVCAADSRALRRRGPRHRRPRAGPPAVSDREADRRGAVLVDRVQPGDPHPFGDDDRLEDADRDLSRQPAQLSTLHAGAPRAARSPALGHDPAVRPGIPRRVPLRGPRHAVEHARAELERGGLPRPGRVWRPGGVLERDRTDPGLRADVGRDAFDVQDRRRHREVRPHRSPDRRRAVQPDRRSRSRAVAGTNLPGRLAHRVPADARALFRARSFYAVRQCRFHRHVSHVQGRPGAEGDILQPACGRQRLPVFEFEGDGPVDPRPCGCPARDGGALRRHVHFQL